MTCQTEWVIEKILLLVELDAASESKRTALSHSCLV